MVTGQVGSNVLWMARHGGLWLMEYRCSSDRVVVCVTAAWLGERRKRPRVPPHPHPCQAPGKLASSGRQAQGSSLEWAVSTMCVYVYAVVTTKGPGNLLSCTVRSHTVQNHSSHPSPLLVVRRGTDEVSPPCPPTSPQVERNPLRKRG